ncbi:hypothetical protein J2Z69_000723 [Paenibacillus shirakamiensis]|uniref:Peptidase M10 metallopeptidase domain-containing protein n=1 Tax=Paenibacillus shirakamiensis TaxID=1265935 RepID=A0ABS4JDA6_9BACL|nr:hypothetical protein [Paenibacillus shirakamiensis]MBP1999704.1 hypothetical protein [Paenibacillus shirakamiensis]
MKKKISKAILASALLSLSVGSVSYAHYYSGGFDLYSMSYRLIDSAGSTAFSKAASNWTSAVGTTITKNSTSLNAGHYGEMNYGWFGLYDPTGSPTKYFHIYVNTTAIHSYQGCNSNPGACAISTTTHEFGHAQYLNDIETGFGDNAIMSYQRDRTKTTAPQQHDINDIRSYRTGATSKDNANSYNPEPHADWPEFKFDELVSKQSDLVVQVKVLSNQEKPAVEGLPPARLSKLQVINTIQGSAPNEITLDQALDFVKIGKTYILVLKKIGDYYYESDKNSVILEENGSYNSNIPDFKKRFTEFNTFKSSFTIKKSSL